MCFSKNLRRTESNEIGLYLDVLVWFVFFVYNNSCNTDKGCTIAQKDS